MNDKEIKVSHFVAQFRRDRNKALLSLDKEEILRFSDKYGAELPTHNDEVFWRAVHKARTACSDLPLHERQLSKDFLDKRGSESFDDGDLT